ncbi:MAG: DUF4430 domain-containing protein [Planctomycetes bacterium]|nr:DUF4430 domain-containing protein [Planctomycetota bacterium]
MFVVPLIVFLFAAVAARTPHAADPEPQKKLIRLVVDYNDGVEKHFTRIAWKKDMKVLDAMNQAKASPHGITLTYRGSGATAFLTQIDDLKNEGGGAGKKNWLYRVNGKLASKSFGVYILEPRDVVTWKFDDGRDE